MTFERAKAISAAKVQVGRANKFVGQNAIQLFGGMGMTDETSIGHYFKRATMIEGQFGSVRSPPEALRGICRSARRLKAGPGRSRPSRTVLTIEAGMDRPREGRSVSIASSVAAELQGHAHLTEPASGNADANATPEAQAREATVKTADDRAFFGHPKGLAYLLGTEVGWAFAYYGLQIALTLYMTQTLLKPGACGACDRLLAPIARCCKACMGRSAPTGIALPDLRPRHGPDLRPADPRRLSR